MKKLQPNVTLRVEARTLLKEATIRGAKGFKAQKIPAGTAVYLIVFVEAARYFKAVYVSKTQAEQVAKTMAWNDSRFFEPEMWDWNFVRIPPHLASKPIVTRPRNDEGKAMEWKP